MGASHAWERRGISDFQVVDKKTKNEEKKERGRISQEEEEIGKEEERRAL
jgi:hypothetical protein